MHRTSHRLRIQRLRPSRLTKISKVNNAKVVVKGEAVVVVPSAPHVQRCRVTLATVMTTSKESARTKESKESPTSFQRLKNRQHLQHLEGRHQRAMLYEHQHSSQRCIIQMLTKSQQRHQQHSPCTRCHSSTCRLQPSMLCLHTL